MAGSPKFVGPWEVAEPQPPADQFREFMDAEPEFKAWAKPRKISDEMRQVKKSKRESF